MKEFQQTALKNPISILSEFKKRERKSCFVKTREAILGNETFEDAKIFGKFCLLTYFINKSIKIVRFYVSLCVCLYYV